MRIVNLIKYSFTSTVLISTISYILLAENFIFFSLFFPFLILYGIWSFDKEKRISHKLSLLLSIFFTMFFLIDISIISRNLLSSGSHLLILLTFHRLLTLKNDKDYLLLLLFSFLLITSSGSISPNLIFIIFFFFFVFLSIFSLILMSLYKGNFRVKKGSLPSLLRISLISTLVTFFASPVFFFTVPRLGIGIGSLIGSNPPLVSGFTENINLGDIGTIMENNKVVMRILTYGSTTIPDDHLWRGKGYNSFDGKKWSSTVMASKGMEIKKNLKGKKTLAFLNLEPLGTDVIFVPYNLEWIRGIRVVKDDANGTLSSPFGAFTKRSYQVEFRSHPQKVLPFHEPDIKPYLQLPEFQQNIFKLAKEISGNLKDHELIAKKIEDYLKKEFKYSLNVPKSTNPVEDFLLKRREGHCEYFSSAMAILLRHLGIPARVVNGFKRGEFNPTGRYYVVREKDAHSWTEVYIEGKGWVAFDPTPSIFSNYRRNFFVAMRDIWDAVQFWWDRNFVTYSPQKQITVYFGLYESLRELISKIEKLKYLLILSLLIFSSLFYILLKKRRKKGVDEEEEMNWMPRRLSPLKFYNRFLKIVRLKGFSISENETPLEFMERIKRSFPEHEDLYFITDIYYKVRYGGRNLKKDDIIKIENALRNLRGKR